MLNREQVQVILSNYMHNFCNAFGDFVSSKIISLREIEWFQGEKLVLRDNESLDDVCVWISSERTSERLPTEYEGIRIFYNKAPQLDIWRLH